MKILLMALIFNTHLFALEKEKVIYEYKKYEKFDLGNLEVQGELIAPGDISVRERDRKRFELDLHARDNFDDFVAKDIESLR